MALESQKQFIPTSDVYNAMFHMWETNGFNSTLNFLRQNKVIQRQFKLEAGISDGSIDENQVKEFE